MVQSRLLDIAVREFGSKGAEGVSTREIAAAAGTAMSSITYHYGGKDGLYLAAARHVAESMADALAPAMACEPVPDDPAHARECVHSLLRHLIDVMAEDDDPDASLFIMREQMHPTAAFAYFCDGAMGQMATRLIALVGLATGAAKGVAEINAMLLFGQVIVWRATRALAARLLDPPPTARLDLIRDEIARNTDAILDRLSAGTQEPL